VPIVDSATKSGRVEWIGDADALWDRVRYDKPLGKLRVGSIGANQVSDASSPTEPSSERVDASADDPAYAGLCS
jgi:hypothetical protein